MLTMLNRILRKHHVLLQTGVTRFSNRYHIFAVNLNSKWYLSTHSV